MTEFGLLYTTHVPGMSNVEGRRLIEEGLGAAQLAENLGFDRYYLFENELPGAWHTRAPEVLLGAVATTTSRIRLAYGSACAPSVVNHPVRMAQRVATLDILSDGRLDVAFGVTPSARECGLFGISEHDARAEFPDAVDAVIRAWTESEAGLVQQPHPNLMVACTGPQSVTLAGVHGLGVVCDGSGGPDEARSRRRSYDAAIAARRSEDLLGSFAYEHFTVACRAHVVDGRERVRAQRPVHGNGPRFVADRTYAAYGSVADAIEVVEGLVDAGADEILFVCDRAEIPRDEISQTIDNLGERVIPHFRGAGLPVSASQPLAG